jgi:hypothetical protein
MLRALAALMRWVVTPGAVGGVADEYLDSGNGSDGYRAHAENTSTKLAQFLEPRSYLAHNKSLISGGGGSPERTALPARFPAIRD